MRLTDEEYMRRALQLAARGRGFTAPNPMVGAVIVAPNGRIIGEGWHRLCGQAHAEVNAVASVSEADRPLLEKSTIYVTLEPCSHWGKTPPCACLLLDRKFPRVVVGATDPNPKVDGRGLRMLREGGVEVVSGVLGRESEELNKVFFTAQRRHRPYITLKWAQSADGFMDCERTVSHPRAYRFSTPAIRMTTMQLRAENEAILTTAATVNADNPSMGLHGWSGREPRVFVVEGEHTRMNPQAALAEKATVLRVGEGDVFARLFADYGVTSVLVEAGGRYLGSLLEKGQWDELRVEIAPVVLGSRGRVQAPKIPLPTAVDCVGKRDAIEVMSDTAVDDHRLMWLRNRAPF